MSPRDFAAPRAAARTIACMLAAALMIAAGPARAAPPPEATQPVERLTDALIATMKRADELGVQERYQRLEPVLKDAFDFRFMARLTTGRHWDELSEAQRARLVETFAAMSIATHAARFEGYNGHRFEIGAPEQGPRGAVLVPTKLHKPDGDPVALDYLVHREDGAWRIIDVYLQGRYSELAVKRSEYTSVLANHGFEDLIARLENKVAKLKGSEDA